MSKVSAVAELTAVIDLETKKGENPHSFAERLARAANGLEDDDWATLSEETQLWVNTAIKAIQDKEEVPLPAGIEDLDLSGEETEEVITEDGEVIAADEVSAIVEQKGNGVKKVKASKAKAAPAKKAAAPKAKAAKAAKPTAKPAKKAAVSGERRGPKGQFSGSDAIKLLAKENPFRPGTKSAGWYSKYKDGMTVDEAIKAGVPRHHTRWNKTLGNIKIG